MILLVCFNFVLKQTFHKAWMAYAFSAMCALFVAFTWPWASEQSKSQLQDWLNNPPLMLDVAVVLSIEIVVQMAYCIMAARLMDAVAVRRRTLLIYKILRWFPGLLIFPVLLHLETRCMFWLTGVAFATIARGLAVIVLLAVPALVQSLKWLIPEKELRLEMFFLSNTLMAVLGIIATVNGRTAVAGVSEVNWSALFGLTGLVILGATAGFAVYRTKTTLAMDKCANDIKKQQS